ncbi:hypothetical protein OAK51_06705 [Alphaproteobacteria bacterium]|nr:hypothetical protein [Alphaproteobacteria bacterium]
MFQVYKKFFLFLGVTVFLCIIASIVWSKSEVKLVEIKLINNLDDKRGFCVDIKGHKNRAKIHRGLQAHTCYSYQGNVAVDQGLDSNRLKLKVLFFPYFNVCVDPTSYNRPLSLTLVKCKNTPKFIFAEDNTIRFKNNTNLCLTVAKKPSRKGGGGSPVHLIRNLSMQICNNKDFAYQTWVIRHIKKGMITETNLSKF